MNTRYLPNHQEGFSQGSQVIKTFLINYIDTPPEISLEPCWPIIRMKGEKSCAVSVWGETQSGDKSGWWQWVSWWSDLTISSDLPLARDAGWGTGCPPREIMEMVSENNQLGIFRNWANSRSTFNNVWHIIFLPWLIQATADWWG